MCVYPWQHIYTVCSSTINKLLTCKVLPESNPETEVPQIWLKNTKSIIAYLTETEEVKSQKLTKIFKLDTLQDFFFDRFSLNIVL